MIDTLLRKRIPRGARSIDMGVIIHNVATAAALADYFETGKPLIERVITVVGDDLTDEDRSKLLAIADKCPVHRTLEAASAIATVLAD